MQNSVMLGQSDAFRVNVMTLSTLTRSTHLLIVPEAIEEIIRQREGYTEINLRRSYKVISVYTRV